MLTETEAKTKWCPFARVATQYADGKPINRVGSDSEESPVPVIEMIFDESKCIGSDCMAWRWKTSLPTSFVPKPTSTGHCGLAGTP